jgi:poly(3-hydroxybutyrate) depolymerase
VNLGRSGYHARQRPAIRRSRFAIGCLLALIAAATAVRAQKVAKQSMTSGDQARTYYTFMPEGTDPVPLVVLLHGSGRDGTTLIERWESLAKQEGIALVAPDALQPRAWTIARDGPAFFHELVESIRAGGRIDGRRIYLFGHSAGGHHSIDLALLESEYFAAVAVHAGALTHDRDVMTSHADRRIPIAMWNGTDDRVVDVRAVRQVRDFLVAKGFDATLTEMPRHTHDYYGRAKEINEAAWQFLKAHRLPGEPAYKTYIVRD